MYKHWLISRRWPHAKGGRLDEPPDTGQAGRLHHVDGAHDVDLVATVRQLLGDAADTAVAASRVGLQLSRAGRHIGKEAIQLHGGIGMTAEYSIGAYTAHLQALEQLLGDATQHLAVLGAGVGSYGAVEPV